MHITSSPDIKKVVIVKVLQHIVKYSENRTIFIKKSFFILVFSPFFHTCIGSFPFRLTTPGKRAKIIVVIYLY